MDAEIREEGEELIFPENFENGSHIFFFGFQCNNCTDQWFGTMGKCPRCGNMDFEVLSSQEAADLRYQQVIEDRIHYVFLNGGK